MIQSLLHSKFFKCIAMAVLIAYVSLIPAQSGYTQVLPKPGQMVFSTKPYTPALMVGLRVDLKDPFNLYFVMNKGQAVLDADARKQEYSKLVKYFLASLVIPNNDIWVNLSPKEAERIIPDNLSLTEMGRDLLAQDYLLKQFTASMISPETLVGKKFWDKVYQQAYERYGTTDIPVDTFNKVWITADKADIYQKNDTALLVDSHLKVQLEQDFMAAEPHKEKFFGSEVSSLDKTASSQLASGIVREVIVPLIEKEVNEGSNFVQVRQIYSTMILATWFKKTLKDSLLGKVYADESKVAGIAINDPEAKSRIYRQYLEAYKVGVFNFIKEERDIATQEMLPRKYFSGGLVAVNPAIIDSKTTVDQAASGLSMIGRNNIDMAAVTLDAAEGGKRFINPVVHPRVNASRKKPGVEKLQKAQADAAAAYKDYAEALDRAANLKPDAAQFPRKWNRFMNRLYLILSLNSAIGTALPWPVLFDQVRNYQSSTQTISGGDLKAPPAVREINAPEVKAVAGLRATVTDRLTGERIPDMDVSGFEVVTSTHPLVGQTLLIGGNLVEIIPGMRLQMGEVSALQGKIPQGITADKDGRIIVKIVFSGDIKENPAAVDASILGMNAKGPSFKLPTSLTVLGDRVAFEENQRSAAARREIERSVDDPQGSAVILASIDKNNRWAIVKEFKESYGSGLDAFMSFKASHAANVTMTPYLTPPPESGPVDIATIERWQKVDLGDVDAMLEAGKNIVWRVNYWDGTKYVSTILCTGLKAAETEKLMAESVKRDADFVRNMDEVLSITDMNLQRQRIAERFGIQYKSNETLFTGMQVAWNRFGHIEKVLGFVEAGDVKKELNDGQSETVIIVRAAPEFSSEQFTTDGKTPEVLLAAIEARGFKVPQEGTPIEKLNSLLSDLVFQQDFVSRVINTDADGFFHLPESWDRSRLEDRLGKKNVLNPVETRVLIDAHFSEAPQRSKDTVKRTKVLPGDTNSYMFLSLREIEEAKNVKTRPEQQLFPEGSLAGEGVVLGRNNDEKAARDLELARYEVQERLRAAEMYANSLNIPLRIFMAATELVMGAAGLGPQAIFGVNAGIQGVADLIYKPNSITRGAPTEEQLKEFYGKLIFIGSTGLKAQEADVQDQAWDALSSADKKAYGENAIENFKKYYSRNDQKMLFNYINDIKDKQTRAYFLSWISTLANIAAYSLPTKEVWGDKLISIPGWRNKVYPKWQVYEQEGLFNFLSGNALGAGINPFTGEVNAVKFLSKAFGANYQYVPFSKAGLNLSTFGSYAGISINGGALLSGKVEVSISPLGAPWRPALQKHLLKHLVNVLNTPADGRVTQARLNKEFDISADALKSEDISRNKHDVSLSWLTENGYVGQDGQPVEPVTWTPGMAERLKAQYPSAYERLVDILRAPLAYEVNPVGTFTIGKGVTAYSLKEFLAMPQSLSGVKWSDEDAVEMDVDGRKVMVPVFRFTDAHGKERVFFLTLRGVDYFKQKTDEALRRDDEKSKLHLTGGAVVITGSSDGLDQNNPEGMLLETRWEGRLHSANSYLWSELLVARADLVSDAGKARMKHIMDRLRISLSAQQRNGKFRGFNTSTNINTKEATGYEAVPVTAMAGHVIIAYEAQTGDRQYHDLLYPIADYLLSIQDGDGAFPLRLRSHFEQKAIDAMEDPKAKADLENLLYVEPNMIVNATLKGMANLPENMTPGRGGVRGKFLRAAERNLQWVIGNYNGSLINHSAFDAPMLDDQTRSMAVLGSEEFTSQILKGTPQHLAEYLQRVLDTFGVKVQDQYTGLPVEGFDLVPQGVADTRQMRNPSDNKRMVFYEGTADGILMFEQAFVYLEANGIDVTALRTRINVYKESLAAVNAKLGGHGLPAWSKAGEPSGAGYLTPENGPNGVASSIMYNMVLKGVNPLNHTGSIELPVVTAKPLDTKKAKEPLYSTDYEYWKGFLLNLIRHGGAFEGCTLLSSPIMTSEFTYRNPDGHNVFVQLIAPPAKNEEQLIISTGNRWIAAQMSAARVGDGGITFTTRQGVPIGGVYGSATVKRFMNAVTAQGVRKAVFTANSKQWGNVRLRFDVNGDGKLQDVIGTVIFPIGKTIYVKVLDPESRQEIVDAYRDGRLLESRTAGEKTKIQYNDHGIETGTQTFDPKGVLTDERMTIVYVAENWFLKQSAKMIDLRKPVITKLHIDKVTGARSIEIFGLYKRPVWVITTDAITEHYFDARGVVTGSKTWSNKGTLYSPASGRLRTVARAADKQDHFLPGNFNFWREVDAKTGDVQIVAYDNENSGRKHAVMLTVDGARKVYFYHYDRTFMHGRVALYSAGKNQKPKLPAGSIDRHAGSMDAFLDRNFLIPWKDGTFEFATEKAIKENPAFVMENAKEIARQDVNGRTIARLVPLYNGIWQLTSTPGFFDIYRLINFMDGTSLWATEVELIENMPALFKRKIKSIERQAIVKDINGEEESRVVGRIFLAPYSDDARIEVITGNTSLVYDFLKYGRGEKVAPLRRTTSQVVGNEKRVFIEGLGVNKGITSMEVFDNKTGKLLRRTAPAASRTGNQGKKYQQTTYFDAKEHERYIVSSPGMTDQGIDLLIDGVMRHHVIGVFRYDAKKDISDFVDLSKLGTRGEYVLARRTFVYEGRTEIGFTHWLPKYFFSDTDIFEKFDVSNLKYIATGSLSNSNNYIRIDGQETLAWTTRPGEVKAQPELVRRLSRNPLIREALKRWGITENTPLTETISTTIQGGAVTRDYRFPYDDQKKKMITVRELNGRVVEIVDGLDFDTVSGEQVFAYAFTPDFEAKSFRQTVPNTQSLFQILGKKVELVHRRAMHEFFGVEDADLWMDMRTVGIDKDFVPVAVEETPFLIESVNGNARDYLQLEPVMRPLVEQYRAADNEAARADILHRIRGIVMTHTKGAQHFSADAGRPIMHYLEPEPMVQGNVLAVVRANGETTVSMNWYQGREMELTDGQGTRKVKMPVNILPAAMKIKGDGSFGGLMVFDKIEEDPVQAFEHNRKPDPLFRYVVLGAELLKAMGISVGTGQVVYTDDLQILTQVVNELAGNQTAGTDEPGGKTIRVRSFYDSESPFGIFLLSILSENGRPQYVTKVSLGQDFGKGYPSEVANNPWRNTLARLGFSGDVKNVSEGSTLTLERRPTALDKIDLYKTEFRDGKPIDKKKLGGLDTNVRDVKQNGVWVLAGFVSVVLSLMAVGWRATKSRFKDGKRRVAAMKAEQRKAASGGNDGSPTADDAARVADSAALPDMETPFVWSAYGFQSDGARNAERVFKGNVEEPLARGEKLEDILAKHFTPYQVWRKTIMGKTDAFEPTMEDLKILYLIILNCDILSNDMTDYISYLFDKSVEARRSGKFSEFGGFIRKEYVRWHTLIQYQITLFQSFPGMDARNIVSYEDYFRQDDLNDLFRIPKDMENPKRMNFVEWYDSLGYTLDGKADARDAIYKAVTGQVKNKALDLHKAMRLLAVSVDKNALRMKRWVTDLPEYKEYIRFFRSIQNGEGQLSPADGKMTRVQFRNEFADKIEKFRGEKIFDDLLSLGFFEETEGDTARVRPLTEAFRAGEQVNDLIQVIGRDAGIDTTLLSSDQQRFDWLNNSTVIFDLFVKAKNAGRLSDDQLKDIEAAIANLGAASRDVISAQRWSEWVNTPEGQQFKRSLLAILYPNETPKSPQVLLATLYPIESQRMIEMLQAAADERFSFGDMTREEALQRIGNKPLMMKTYADVAVKNGRAPYFWRLWRPAIQLIRTQTHPYAYIAMQVLLSLFTMLVLQSIVPTGIAMGIYFLIGISLKWVRSLLVFILDRRLNTTAFGKAPPPFIGYPKPDVVPEEKTHRRIFLGLVGVTKTVWDMFMFNSFLIPVMHFLGATFTLFNSPVNLNFLLNIGLWTPAGIFFYLCSFAFVYQLEFWFSFKQAKQKGLGMVKTAKDVRKMQDEGMVDDLTDLKMLPKALELDEEERSWARQILRQAILEHMRERKDITEEEFAAAKNGKFDDFSIESVRKRMAVYLNSLWMDSPDMPVFEDFPTLTTIIPMLGEDNIYSYKETKGMSTSLDVMMNTGFTNLGYMVSRGSQSYKIFIDAMEREGKASKDEIRRMKELIPAEPGEIVKKELGSVSPVLEMEIRLWASNQGQPFARTLDGVMNHVRMLHAAAKINHPEWLNQGVVAIDKLRAIALIQGTILDPDNPDGIWEFVSPTEVRIKSGLAMTEFSEKFSFETLLQDFRTRGITVPAGADSDFLDSVLMDRNTYKKYLKLGSEQDTPGTILPTKRDLKFMASIETLSDHDLKWFNRNLIERANPLCPKAREKFTVMLTEDGVRDIVKSKMSAMSFDDEDTARIAMREATHQTWLIFQQARDARLRAEANRKFQMNWAYQIWGDILNATAARPDLVLKRQDAIFQLKKYHDELGFDIEIASLQQDKNDRGEDKGLWYRVLARYNGKDGNEAATEDIFKIRLTKSPPIITEGKPGNHTHALSFVTGEFALTLDMNQDFFPEQAAKIPILLQEFEDPQVNIVDYPEMIYTDGFSPIGEYEAMTDRTFVTASKREMAVQGTIFNYGHPPIWRTMSARLYGGVSATTYVNEDIITGFVQKMKSGFFRYTQNEFKGKFTVSGLLDALARRGYEIPEGAELSFINYTVLKDKELYKKFTNVRLTRRDKEIIARINELNLHELEAFNRSIINRGELKASPNHVRQNVVIFREYIEAGKGREVSFVGVDGIKRKFGMGAIQYMLGRHAEWINDYLSPEERLANHLLGPGFFSKKIPAVIGLFTYNFFVQGLGLSPFPAFSSVVVLALVGVLMLGQAIVSNGWGQMMIEDGYIKGTKNFLKKWIRMIPIQMANVFTTAAGAFFTHSGPAFYHATGRGFNLAHPTVDTTILGYGKTHIISGAFGIINQLFAILTWRNWSLLLSAPFGAVFFALAIVPFWYVSGAMARQGVSDNDFLKLFYGWPLTAKYFDGLGFNGTALMATLREYKIVRADGRIREPLFKQFNVHEKSEIRNALVAKGISIDVDKLEEIIVGSIGDKRISTAFLKKNFLDGWVASPAALAGSFVPARLRRELISNDDNESAVLRAFMFDADKDLDKSRKKARTASIDELLVGITKALNNPELYQMIDFTKLVTRLDEEPARLLERVRAGDDTITDFERLRVNRALLEAVFPESILKIPRSLRRIIFDLSIYSICMGIWASITLPAVGFSKLRMFIKGEKFDQQLEPTTDVTESTSVFIRPQLLPKNISGGQSGLAKEQGRAHQLYLKWKALVVKEKHLARQSHADEKNTANSGGAGDKKSDDSQDRSKVGGIDLDDKNLTINIRVDGQGMPLPLQFQDPAMVHIQGLSPVIRDIAPVSAVNMPVLAELMP